MWKYTRNILWSYFRLIVTYVSLNWDRTGVLSAELIRFIVTCAFACSVLWQNHCRCSQRLSVRSVSFGVVDVSTTYRSTAKHSRHAVQRANISCMRAVFDVWNGRHSGDRRFWRVRIIRCITSHDSRDSGHWLLLGQCRVGSAWQYKNNIQQNTVKTSRNWSWNMTC